MTPQTAAALRALVTKWRKESEDCEAKFSDSGIGWGGVTHARHADELAAVLTQEGAGIDRAALCGMSVSMDVSTGDDDAGNRIFGKVYEVMDHAGDKHDVTLLAIETERNFAPAELRAASDELTTFAANLAANQRVPDEVDAIVNAGIDKLLDEPQATNVVELVEKWRKDPSHTRRDDAEELAGVIRHQLSMLDKQYNEYHAAQSEPRAAEGAGTGGELKRAYAHQQRIRACAAWSDVINQKTGEIDESKAKYAGSCEQQLTKAIDDLANTPTAAAAVPAGGDAWHAVNVNEWVRVKLTQAGLDVLQREHDELAERVPKLGPWFPPHKDANGYSQFQLWGLMQSFGPFISLGMPHNFFEPNEIQFATPAPRGGVTEAMREFVEVMLIDLSHGGGLLIKGNTDSHAKLTTVLEAYLSTPPAAQAQDAGPMARRRVFVDMDGVIVDFDKRKTELGLTGDEIKSLHGAYLDMEPLPGAIEAVRSVIGMGFDVWLATKPPTGVAHAYSDKAAWVFQHLPELKRKLVITHDKGMLGCERDVLIDDRPHKANCEKFRGTLIPFTNGKTWADVLAQLRALEAKEAK